MKIKKRIASIALIFLLANLSVLGSAEIYGSTAADISFESGTLSLVEMTSFSFGTHTISSATKSYPALDSSIFIDIKDLRGTGVGWHLTALASEFNPAETPTLPGTFLSLLNGVPVSAHPAGTAPNVVNNIKLECDGVATESIATAQAGSGLGVWTIEWNGNDQNNDSVTLNVLGGVATKGIHTATITWTLADTP